MAGYKFDLGKNFSIKPKVGGYFAVGINGDSFVKGVDNFDQPYEAMVNTFSHTENKNGVAPFRSCNRADGGLAFALNLLFKSEHSAIIFTGNAMESQTRLNY